MLFFIWTKFSSVVSPKASAAWIGTTLMLLFISLQSLDEADAPLRVSTGTITSYSFARGGDFSLILKLDESQNMTLYFNPYRSTLSGHIADRVGKNVKVEYYGNRIANCWEGSAQFCFSKCNSDAQCSRDFHDGERKILHVSVLLSVLAYAVTFIWVVFFRRM